MNVQGKRVLVMGVSSGIGLAITQTLCARIAWLSLTAWRPGPLKVAVEVAVRDRLAP